MANTTAEIKRTVSFLAFAREHDGKVAYVNCTNKTTGDIFKACAFGVDKDTRVFCSFGPSLGELTQQELIEQQHDIDVVEWDNPEQGTHGYTFCKHTNSENWQDVSSMLDL